MAKSFTADIARFGEKAIAKAELIFKQSAQTVYENAQRPVARGGSMPVDTGFLRNSLVAGLNGSTSLAGPDAYVLAVAGANLDDSIFAGWTANYARFVEYGSSRRPGRFFALKAAQQWQAIVAENAARVAAQ